MAFEEIFRAGHSAQSRAGKIAPTFPLRQPITAQDIINCTTSRPSYPPSQSLCARFPQFPRRKILTLDRKRHYWHYCKIPCEITPIKLTSKIQQGKALLQCDFALHEESGPQALKKSSGNQSLAKNQTPKKKNHLASKSVLPTSVFYHICPLARPRKHLGFTLI